MEASHEDDDLFNLVNCTISYLMVVVNLLWVSTPVCCLICGQNVVIEILWCCCLECNDFWGMWNSSEAKHVAMFGLWGSHHFPSSYEYVFMTHKVYKCMWCVKRLSNMIHGEHHNYCKEITNVFNVSFRSLFQVAQIALWLRNKDLPLPLYPQHHDLIILLSIPCIQCLFYFYILPWSLTLLSTQLDVTNNMWVHSQ